MGPAQAWQESARLPAGAGAAGVRRDAQGCTGGAQQGRPAQRKPGFKGRFRGEVCDFIALKINQTLIFNHCRIYSALRLCQSLGVKVPTTRRANRRRFTLVSFDFSLFRENLLSHMKSKNLKAAQLSKMAGLNPRAVKDIEEERIKNPRIQTVLALEAAMELPFGKLLGKSVDMIDGELLSLLGELDEATQKQLLMTLQSLSAKKTHSL